MTVALIDDQLVSSVLRGATPNSLGDAELYTTGYWYVRLCQAVLSASERAGTLSRPFAALPGELRDRAIQLLLELPEDIGLISLRDLAPSMGRLRSTSQLNILGIEVLAAAKYLGADVFLSASSPNLEAALIEEGLAVHVGAG